MPDQYKPIAKELDLDQQRCSLRDKKGILKLETDPQLVTS